MKEWVKLHKLDETRTFYFTSDYLFSFRLQALGYELWTEKKYNRS